VDRNEGKKDAQRLQGGGKSCNGPLVCMIATSGFEKGNKVTGRKNCNTQKSKEGEVKGRQIRQNIIGSLIWGGGLGFARTKHRRNQRTTKGKVKKTEGGMKSAWLETSSAAGEGVGNQRLAQENDK